MRNQLLATILLASALITTTSCTRNPITGRNQLTLVSESEVQSLAKTQYHSFLSQNKVISSSSSHNAELVKKVGSKIAAAVTHYYNQKGLASQLEGYHWEYNLVENKEANAWCMPGGKIVVYTGLLPITQNEAALAFVLGHEITHAVARHGVERMSEGLVQQLGGAALSVALLDKPAETQNLFLQAYGVGTSVGVMLRFSRKQEYEADKFGLMFAAMAGYNPKEAIPLWERMEASGNGQHTPEFLSDHPWGGNRIQRLQDEMPEALKYYKASD